MELLSISQYPPHVATALQSKECHYYDFSTIGTISIVDELMPQPGTSCDVKPAASAAQFATFDGFSWTTWTAQRWSIPLVASVIYITMIAVLKQVMASRDKMRLQAVVVAWNFSLSLFSLAGLYYCVPHLLFGQTAGLFSHGFYESVCSHASSFGFGEVGFFVFLFIYSKLAELLDTLWLVLRKSPVILLHWYHHVTVLLYCWHAYSVRIGTGLWFAAMNYSVHAIMYFYFGLTQCGPKGRAFARRFAMLITTLQLTQMVVGIVVTVASVVYHASGKPCYVSMFNSALGLMMYASYFVLFLQLFLHNYIYSAQAKASNAKGPRLAESCPPDFSHLKQAAHTTNIKGKTD